jgi:hypothetical protein
LVPGTRNIGTTFRRSRKVIHTNIPSNGKVWDQLVMFQVEAKIAFNLERLTHELQERIRLVFPDHAQGVTVNQLRDDRPESKRYVIVYPPQTIVGKKLTIGSLVDVLKEIEDDVLEAVRQSGLLELVSE